MTHAEELLIRNLRALPQLTSPQHLADNVMARIATATPELRTTAEMSHANTARTPSARATLAHAAAGIAMVLPGYAAALAIRPIEQAAARGVPTSPGLLSMTMVLALSLALYATGLYLPISGRRRR